MQDTTGHTRVQRDATGYNRVQQGTAGHKRKQRDTTGGLKPRRSRAARWPAPQRQVPERCSFLVHAAPAAKAAGLAKQPPRWPLLSAALLCHPTSQKHVSKLQGLRSAPESDSERLCPVRQHVQLVAHVSPPRLRVRPGLLRLDLPFYRDAARWHAQSQG